MDLIVITSALIFGSLSLLHVYWAFGGEVGVYKAIPTKDGQLVFSPSRFMTLFVALSLAICGAVVLLLGYRVQFNIPFFQYVVYIGWVFAGLFLLRAIGDFKLVGFFKTVKDSEFARYDSLFYSPLCLVLSLVFFGLAYFS